jgi:hypothetical protein
MTIAERHFVESLPLTRPDSTPGRHFYSSLLYDELHANPWVFGIWATAQYSIFAKHWRYRQGRNDRRQSSQAGRDRAEGEGDIMSDPAELYRHNADDCRQRSFQARTPASLGDPPSAVEPPAPQHLLRSRLNCSAPAPRLDIDGESYLVMVIRPEDGSRALSSGCQQ